MTKKKTPETIEECAAEIELTQKKIRQLENRNKMLDQKLTAEKRRARNHRLIVRGAILESIIPEAKDMTDEEVSDLLRAALTSEEAKAFLRKRDETEHTE